MLSFSSNLGRWSIALLSLNLGAACSASSGGTAGGAQPGSGGQGSMTSSGGGVSVSSDAGPRIVTGTDSSSTTVPSSVTEQDAYSITCQIQNCTSNEICVPTNQGSECATACPGQPCLHAGSTPYCTRTGGVICTTPWPRSIRPIGHGNCRGRGPAGGVL